MEKLWNLYGSFMEKILDWNVEKLWSICGKTDMEKLWKTNTLENCRLENIKDALQWSNTRNQTEGLNMLRKILDWATSESGKEVLTGVIWGIVGIIAVRLFCFLVCLATGYPADIWNIF